MKLAAARQDRFGNDDVRSARQRAIGDQRPGLIEDLLDGPGNLLFLVPAGTEHVSAKMDDRGRPDGGQQPVALVVRDVEVPGDHLNLPGRRRNVAGGGIGPLPGGGI